MTHRIISDSWTIRKACTSDCELYWDWVNDPEVRQNAFNSKIITWKEHQEWFKSKLDDSATTLYLVESILGPIGQVRFDGSGQNHIISYSIGRQFRGIGLGKRLLASAIEVYPNTRGFNLIGEVKINNLQNLIHYQLRT